MSSGEAAEDKRFIKWLRGGGTRELVEKTEKA